MNQNLITRLGLASGVVAALVALVFVFVIQAAGDVRSAESRANSAEGVLVESAQHGSVPRAQVLGAMRAAVKAHEDAVAAADRERTLGIGGAAVAALLLLLLTAYLSRYIVIPLRTVTNAATDLAEGDLGVRVLEEGDAEPLALARAFNTMAASLQASTDAFAAQNADLERIARVNLAILDATPDPVGLIGVDAAPISENAPMAALRAAGAPIDAPGEDPDRSVRDELVLGERTYSRYAAPVRDHSGLRMGRLVVLRDVSAERESERLKDEFFALVSHELRTPLTSIIGYLELVQDDRDALPPDAARFLEVVERNANRLLRLVGDMLFIAQAEAGRLALERGTVDLAAVLAESVEAARPAAERGGVALALHQDAAASVAGDPDRLGQMTDNLVSNALKFTPPGGRVDVRLAADGKRAIVEVSDDGPGIPAIEQPRLFERFFRSEAATLNAVPGAGLGLTIVQTIVQAHGGTIAVESREGTGTTMRVSLPRVAGGPAAEAGS